MPRLSRRAFIGAVAASGAAGGAARERGREGAAPRYIAAYDTESPRCLAACRKIVQVHRRFEMPATFFIVGRTLEANAKEYRALLADPLFEVASHTWSHRMLRDHPMCGPAVSHEERRVEIRRGKECIERVFERPCFGLRPACGFEEGFRGAPDVLGLVREAGFKYTSGLLWGPDWSMPALLRDPFPYAEEGFPELWELPGHGWHENLLKDNNRWGARRLTLWPQPMPEAIPADFVRNARDEFQVNRAFIDKALSGAGSFVSLIWHPWSLGAFDPEQEMLALTFEYVRKRGLHPSTYAGLLEAVAG